MSNNVRTGRNSAKAPPAGAHAQPRLLGWVVLFGGAISTWCWYRPLPNRLEPGTPVSAAAADSSLHAATAFPQPAALLAPSPGPMETRGEPTQPSKATIGPLPEDLIGEQEVAMQPFHEDRHRALKDRVGREPLPVVPIDGPLSALGRSPQKPPLWTDGERQDPYRNLADRKLSNAHSVALAPLPDALSSSTEADASPFRAAGRSGATKVQALPPDAVRSLANSDTPSKWPDEDFHPAPQGTRGFRSDRPSDVLTHAARGDQTPNSNAFARGPQETGGSRMSLAGSRIRTQDADPEITSLPHPGFPPAVAPQRPAGNIIRQPGASKAQNGSR